MKKKIAIIDPLGAHGSSHHFYLYGQVQGLIENNVNVSLYTNDETACPDVKEIQFYQSYRKLYLNNSKIFSGIKYILGSLYSILHARIKGVKIFHFHVFNTGLLMLFNIFLVKFSFAKSIITVHDVRSFNDFKGSTFFAKLLYTSVNSILTHNKFSKQEIIKINSSLKSKIDIVPHGNYLPFINIRSDKNESRNFLDLPLDKNILLFFGMIKKVKGLEFLLYALKKIIIEHPNTILLIAGKTWKNNFSFYDSIIDDLSLRENIVFHDKFIDYEDVEYYFCASDLVVLPYKRIYQSGVLMMSLSYNRPVLASDLPPIKEIIQDKETGFLFSSEDSDDLASKLIYILSNFEELDKVRVKGNDLIKAKYCWKEIGELTKKVYDKL